MSRSFDRAGLAEVLKRLQAYSATEQIFTIAELETLVEMAGRSLDASEPMPIPIKINCPNCGASHIDVGEFATRSHHSHACQTCGLVWRPALVPTVGVQFLPGMKNEAHK